MRCLRVIGTLLLALPASFATAEQPSLPAAPAGRQDLVLTNQNLGVVVESRSVSLPAGRFELRWEGAPAAARPETWTVTNAREARIRWLGLSGPLPGTGAADSEWLRSLVGKHVRIARPGGSTAEAEVLAVYGATAAQVLFREGNELVYGEPEARLSMLPETGAPARLEGVTLSLDSDRAGSRTITSRYLVGEVSWEASYALSLAADEKRGRLEGWFVVDNRSGGDFAPSRLRLLAGTLRVAATPAPRPMVDRLQVAMEKVASSDELSEARVYEVASPPRLPAGRTTLPLASDAEVAVEKRYVARSTYWMGANEEPQRIPVGVQYRFATRELAKALPAGVVRVYVEDGTVFTGEDRIEHTPERSDVEIETSEAFDLTARRRQVSFQQTGRTESESAYEVVITSRKKEPVTVLVREQFPGDWTVVESSVPPKKLAAFTAEFPVTVPPGGEAKLTYRMRVRMRA